LKKLEQSKKKSSKSQQTGSATQDTMHDQTYQESDDEDYDSRDENTKKLPFWKRCCATKKKHS
jgi:hypothetical protein